jgi:hypothetical protein
MCVAGGKVFGTRSNLRQHIGRHKKIGKERMNRWSNIWDLMVVWVNDRQ